jgi:hypothetical protein
VCPIFYVTIVQIKFRFPEDPFMIKYKMTYPNPDIQAAANNVPPERVAPRHLVRSKSLLPSIWTEPTTDGRCYFTKVEIFINDQKIETQSLDEFGHIWQKINRTFTTDEYCRDKYGKIFPRISNSGKRICAVIANADEELEAAMKSLDFLGWDKDTSNPNVVRFGFDGIFPLTSQSNILRTLTGKENENGYLRPLTSIEIRLFKRVPVDALIDSCNIMDLTYFSADATQAAQRRGSPFQMELTDISLLYESLTPEQKELPSLTKGILKYYVDVPKIRLTNVTGGKKWLEQVCEIPGGTKAIILGWGHSSQLWHDESKHKNLHTRFRFLPNVKKLRLKMTGKDGLIFNDGFDELGTVELCWTSWAHMYHTNLVRRGLYDRDFSDLFPGTAAAVGYNQVLILDMTDHKLKDDFDLTVTTEFNATLSPEGYTLFYISLQQYVYSQTPDFKFSFDLNQ